MLSKDNSATLEVKSFSRVEDLNQSHLFRTEVDLSKDFSTFSKDKIVLLLDKCSECLSNNKISLSWLLRCIMHFSTIRPKDILYFAELYTVLAMFGDNITDLYEERECKTILSYLGENGSLPKVKSRNTRNATKKDETDPIIKEIFEIVITDNIESLIEKYKSHDFNFRMELPIIIENEEKKLSLIQCCSYFGSFECFNLCLINGLFISNDDSPLAIMGGNANIVNIFRQNSFSFDNCFGKAIQYHHYALCDWLLIHYKCEDVKLIHCLECYNYVGFLYYLNNGSDINAKSDGGVTPLHFASERGYFEIARLLIEKGAEINAKTNDRVNGVSVGAKIPLHFASEKGYIEIVKLLIERGADINARAYYGYRRDEIGMTPLHFACENCHIDVVKLLIEKGAEINTQSGRYFIYGVVGEMTPLHFASVKGCKDIVLLLLENGAEINAKAYDYGGYRTGEGEVKVTPLHFASEEGHIDVVKLLIENGAEINAIAYRGYKFGLVEMTSLNYASENGYIDIVKLLIKKGAKINTNAYEMAPIHFACENGYIDIIKILIEHGAEINAMADRYGERFLCKREEALEGRNGLIHSEEELEGFDGTLSAIVRTPLHLACEKGYINIIKLLIENDVEINSESEGENNKWIALHFASQRGYIDIVKLLIKNGAKINAATSYGWIALHFACQKGYIDIVKLLIEKGSEINAKTDLEMTPLHIASEDGYIDIVKLLIEKGADINAKGEKKYNKGHEIIYESGITPLHIASKNGYIDIVKLLIRNGVETNARAYKGDIPMHFASNKCCIDVEKLLIETGVGNNDKVGKTPLDFAEHEGNLDIIEYLKSNFS